MKALPKSVAVIGAGIIGSWTALHLAEAGVETTLFEQFPLPHTRGSSHGLSRAFRFLGEHELGRLDYSLDRWHGLERAAGHTLFVRTGLLNFGPPGDPELEGLMGVLRSAGRSVEWLSAPEIAARFPELRYPEEWGAAWDPDGGILIAHRCLGAVQSEFVSRGGLLRTGRVESIERGDAGLRLHVHETTSGTSGPANFDRVVIAAGPWTETLAPRLKGLLKTLRTPVTYWHDPTDSYAAHKGAPIIFNARLTGVYGLPSLEYPGLAKLLYHGGPDVHPELRDTESFDSLVREVGRYVEEHLPQLDHRKPAIVETCMYTMTPDGYPIIDQLGDGISIGCGFSGSGFKHSPATGKMLAAMALGIEEEMPADFGAERYRLGRFARTGAYH